MASSRGFLLAVHAHQPVGNFGWVLDEAYKNSYFPFFEILKNHPSVKMSAHFSGSLLDWLTAERPEFIRVIRGMVARGQLEVMGGAYYEPIYGMIPMRDLAAQLALMSGKVETLFGRAPEGVWLSERVWDPEILKTVADAGIRYTVLDDHHMTQAGVKAPVTGLYEAVHDNARLEVFASTQKLRYLMPFRPPQETLKFVKSVPSQGPQDALVFADDIEKFGLWPGTHELVYKKNWLEKFFTALEAERQVELFTFSEYRRQFRPKGKLSIPHASYSEMMQWSGGHFKHFFGKYSESRYARDRMLAVSRTVTDAEKAGLPAGVIDRARTALYKAQCNCAYWHGVFGGLYLHHLRSAIFENLIEAEQLVRGAVTEPAAEKLELESGTRWRVRQARIESIFDPAAGAVMEEIDFLPGRVNLGCTLRRRKESYHEAVFNPTGGAVPNEIVMIYRMLGAKHHGLEKSLQIDRTERRSFIEHFYEKPVTREAFMDQTAAEIGDFIGARFDAAVDGGAVAFERLGCLEAGGRQLSLKLEKKAVPVGAGTLEMRYTLTNAGRERAEFVMGVEMNFSIGMKGLGAGIEQRNIKAVELHDEWRDLDIALRTNEAADISVSPVETISESESGLDKTYQGLAVLLQRPFAMPAGESAGFTVSLSVRSKEARDDR